MARGATYAGCALRKKLAPNYDEEDCCKGEKKALGEAPPVEAETVVPLAAAAVVDADTDASCSDDETPVATATTVA